jgi:hypothetical protein
MARSPWPLYEKIGGAVLSVGGLIFGADMNRHHIHLFWLVFSIGLMVIGLGLFILGAVQSHRSKREGFMSEPSSRKIGYVGLPGSKGDLSEAQFSSDLDLGVQNAGEVDAKKARFGVRRRWYRDR